MQSFEIIIYSTYSKDIFVQKRFFSYFNIKPDDGLSFRNM